MNENEEKYLDPNGLEYILTKLKTLNSSFFKDEDGFVCIDYDRIDERGEENVGDN